MMCDYMICEFLFESYKFIKVLSWITCKKCKLTKNSKSYLKYEEKAKQIRNFFDIGFMINKILQIDKLKQILLKDAEKINVFNALFENKVEKSE